MKKTFKRAGVAVLSMAMLLSMGAVGLTANAAVAGETPTAAKTVTVANVTKDNGDPDTGATGAKVGIYQVATRNADGSWAWLDSVAPSITIDGSSKSVVFALSNDPTTAAGQVLVTALEADQLNDLANWLKTNKASFTNKVENQATGTAINLFSNDDSQSVGYYLIVTEPGSGNSKTIQPTLASYDVQTTGDANADVTPKAAGITVDKSITGVTQSDGTAIAEKNVDSCMAEVGSTVSYQIATTTPSYATGVVPQKAFTIYDDPSDAIDIVNNSVKVTVGGVEVIKNGAVESGVENVTYTPATTDGFKIVFEVNYIKEAANQGKEVVVTFNATVGNDAVLGANNAVNAATNKGSAALDKNTNVDASTTRKGNPNSTYIEYANNYSTGGGDGTGEDTVNTFVGKIVIGKFNNDGTTRLSGSKFMLTKDVSGTATNVTNAKITAGVVQPTDSGDLDLGYLAPGTYTLTETEAPAGYKVVAPFTFTVTGANTTAYDTFVYDVTPVTNVDVTGDLTGNAVIKVNDPEADKLPGTGGMGTVLFTVGGAAIVLLAGAMFVVYMRKRKVED